VAPNRHDEAEEIVVVLGGGGKANLDGEIIELHPVDALRLSPAIARAFEAGPDGLELLVVGPHYENDGELLGTEIGES
jgi:quercetin dioxygenase-like cupin family protein